jgi:hypothetical protein
VAVRRFAFSSGFSPAFGQGVGPGSFLAQPDTVSPATGDPPGGVHLGSQGASKGGLVLGGRIGVDASTMEANAALKTIVRRDTGESYRKMLLHMAKESGIDSSTDEDSRMTASA